MKYLTIVLAVLGFMTYTNVSSASVIPEEHLWLVDKYCPEWGARCREVLDECYKEHGTNGYRLEKCMKDKRFHRN